MIFTLCVDDFGIKYLNKKDADHLVNSLKSRYRVSIYHKGENYLGFTLKWNYKKVYVDLTMPDYTPKAIHRFQHPYPSRPVFSPHEHQSPVYGQQIQHATPYDTSKPLD